MCLQYYNARYYDPDLGQFLSPDTLVPDPGNLFDYNRYLYTRGNPMRYTDPTGHYSNDEIMKHFNCSDWACVEGHFGEGGSHTGMWGWLYILQEAQNGDSITTESIASGALGSQHSFLSGTFSQGADGIINVLGNNFVGPNTQSHAFNALMPETAFANFAVNANGYGTYTLQGTNGSQYADSATVHLRTKLQPGNINPADLGIALVKSGQTLGPLVGKIPHPLARTAGAIWQGVGEATALTTDIVGAVHQLIQGNPVPLIETGGGMITDAKTGTPAYSNAYDLAKVLSQGVCIGTGCR